MNAQVALSYAQETERQSYGQTIIKLVERFSCPAVVPGLLGILENHHQMKRRIRMITKFNKTNHWAAVAVALFAGLALVTLTDAQSGQGTQAVSGQADAQGPPNIVATSHRVSRRRRKSIPTITEITVTFDRRYVEVVSHGPAVVRSIRPCLRREESRHWRDKRTCVFPVKLQAAQLLSGRHQFDQLSRISRAADGVPAKPSAIYFATKGASEEIKRKTSKPQNRCDHPHQWREGCGSKPQRAAHYLQRPDGRRFLLDWRWTRIPHDSRGNEAFLERGPQDLRAAGAVEPRYGLSPRIEQPVPQELPECRWRAAGPGGLYLPD